MATTFTGFAPPGISHDIARRFCVVWKHDIGGVRRHFTRLAGGDETQAERTFHRWAGTQHRTGKRFDRIR
jgi:hypothetical protein